MATIVANPHGQATFLLGHEVTTEAVSAVGIAPPGNGLKKSVLDTLLAMAGQTLLRAGRSASQGSHRPTTRPSIQRPMQPPWVLS